MNGLFSWEEFFDMEMKKRREVAERIVEEFGCRTELLKLNESKWPSLEAMRLKGEKSTREALKEGIIGFILMPEAGIFEIIRSNKKEDIS